jgi:cell division protein ZipA
MDKDILRIVIIAIGALVIAGMLLWYYFKNPEYRESFNKRFSFFGDDDSLDDIDDSLAVDTKDDDFDIIPLGGINDHEDSNAVSEDFENFVDEVETEYQMELKSHGAEAEEVELEIPNILQFGIVADEESGFDGNLLRQVFAKVGLEYGPNQVYERLDEYEQVDYAVASMVEPGVFPTQDLDDFSCPGLVCFFQPKLVNDPLTVFDDFLETIHILAEELGGTELDQSRQPLTKNTEDLIRNLLVQENLKL